MPVTSEEFHAARHSAAELAALSFLKENRSLGYTAEEVMVELGSLGIFYSVEEVEVGLSSAVGRQMAEAKLIGGAIITNTSSPLDYEGLEGELCQLLKNNSM